MKRVLIWIPLLFVILNSYGSAGFGGITQRKFLSPSEAFKVEANMTKESIAIKISLAKEIHIYAKDLHFDIVKPQKVPLNVSMPKPTEYEGDKVYYGELNFNIPLREIANKIASDKFTLQVSLAGCSDAGICYQPQTYTFDFTLPKDIKNIQTATQKQTATAIAKSEKEQNFLDKIGSLSAEGNSAKIAKALADEGLIFVLLLFFVAGLLLALTPCILPMIPILSSIIIKQANKEGQVTRSTSFLISLVYVVSMSFTYAMIGVIAGLLGFDIQAHMNNPWIIVPMSALFVALAFSLFGYFELSLPASWQSRLTKVSDNAQGKGLVGTAIMGSLSALIVGTCTAPVISGAIIFISMTGDALLGGISLFVMGIGAGMPLLLVGLGANKLVPKPGGWMQRVSQIFGVIMLMMALYILRGILSPFVFMMIFSLLLMGSAVYMGVFNQNDRVGIAKFIQLIAWVLLLYGSIIFTGALAGASSPINPLEPFIGTKRVATAATSNRPIEQRRGYSLQRLQSEIAQAAKEGKPVIVDIGKQNCAACSELEHITFPHKDVKEAMKRFKFIQIDITKNTPKEQEILKHYKIFGAPNMLFFDSKGNHLPNKLQVGFIKPKDFVEHIRDIK